MQQEMKPALKGGNAAANNWTNVLFGIYILALVWILLLKLGVQFSYMDNRQVNLVPFEPLVHNRRLDYKELIANILVFVPLGIYTGILFKHWAFWKKMAFVGAASLLCEALQYILRIGSFDITDIITNTSGGIIGLVLLLVTVALFNNPNKAQKFVNITATIGTFLLILFLVLLKTNNLWIRYR